MTTAIDSRHGGAIVHTTVYKITTRYEVASVSVHLNKGDKLGDAIKRAISTAEDMDVNWEDRDFVSNTGGIEGFSYESEILVKTILDKLNSEI